MFNEEEDWSDENDSQSLPQIVCKDSVKTNSKKLVGKKSLLRTLQTLGSVPDWKNQDHQQNSDSETEGAPSSAKKKKKKRRKKRRHAKTSEEQQENGDLDESIKEEKPAKPQKKQSFPPKGPKKMKLSSAGVTKEKEITNSAKTNIDKADGAQQLNRQQWKNKMKNKRKCINKFRQNQAAGEEITAESAEKVPKPKEVEKKESKTDSGSNKNSKKSSETENRKKKRETDTKPKKRKQANGDADICCAPQTQTENKTEGTNETPVITDDQQPVPEKKARPELSKEQSQKRDKLRKMLQQRGAPAAQQEVPEEQREVPAAPSNEPAAPAAELKLDRSASLRARMEQRLESARFRYINEVLYSTTSGEAKRMFKQDPQAFWVYHRGYTAQVQRWPTNPLDAIIDYIQQKSPSLVVADFGCGDCKIARSVKNKVHSFDLASTCEQVTVCDMANVPLRDGSVDIAVFCLSLMGTNLVDFLAEANRVLKMGGVLKIAEVASRFENVRNFINALSNLGFKIVSKDTENTHFHSFEYLKTGNAPENVKKFGLQLKPCLYKKR